MIAVLRCTSLFFLLSLSCNDFAEPQERITKLRALGVSAQPSIVTPSTSDSPRSVALKAHLLLPKNQTVDSVEPFIDDDFRFGFVIENLTVTSSGNYTELGELRYFTVDATFVVPTSEVLTAAGSESARLRYGFKVRSGAEEEKIVGDVLLVPENSPALSWQPVNIGLVKPVSDDAVIAASGAELSLDVTSDPSDTVKVGWFVSSGKVKNRRAHDTAWEEIGTGPQVLLATARGLKTKSFSVVVRKVTVQ